MVVGCLQNSSCSRINSYSLTSLVVFLSSEANRTYQGLTKKQQYINVCAEDDGKLEVTASPLTAVMLN